MANQFYLFKKRKFTAMFFTQFLGAFNDNIFKQALILILTYTAASQLALPVSILNNLAAMLFILPYFLFSALAGQVADKYEKSTLVKKIKLLEIIIMATATVGFLFEWYGLLFVALFLMGTHSTFFGPIKYAYLPENMDKDELVGANGLFQMGTSLAILTGMIFAGVLTQLDKPLQWTSVSVMVVAVLGYVAALCIPKTTKTTQAMTIDWHILRTSFRIISYLYRLPLLFFVILGNSWFWFYGAIFLTQTPEFSKSILHGNESVVIFLLTLFSVGTALGSLLCKTLTKNQVSLRLFPIAVSGLTVFAVALYLMLSHWQVIGGEAYYGIGELLAVSGSFWVATFLFLLGFFGGMYIVPLYAFMQAYAPVSHRARIVGANNIFNALFMVVSAIFAMLVVGVLGRSIGELFLLTGLMNALFGVFLYKKLHQYQGSMSMTHADT